MARTEDAKTDRRGFLRLAGLSAVAGGAALVSSGDSVEAAERLAGEAKADGYRATEHVKTFYESARF